jgi:glutaminyl-peptide cyclotransferase
MIKNRRGLSTASLAVLLLWLPLMLVSCQPTTLSATPLPSAILTATAIPTATLAATDIPTATVIITPSSSPARFSGERAYADVEYQVALGPRTPGSQAHDQVIAWIQAELEKNEWQVELQETTYAGQPVRNVIAKRTPSGSTDLPWIVVGAHFDSRLWASSDPDPANQQKPVPGANDGASGVAVLLELGRVLPRDLDKQIWLVFFDAEDQGQIPGWDWILGSRAFVESLTQDPDAMVLVDMIGDADLNIYYERNSNPELSQEIWSLAARLGYEQQFIPTPKYSILDDHTPFLERGIPAVDLIDFDYPYWHTLADTADKVSPASLMAVGDTLQHWLDPRP